MTEIRCVRCQQPFDYQRAPKGRPPTYCKPCASEVVMTNYWKRIDPGTFVGVIPFRPDKCKPHQGGRVIQSVRVKGNQGYHV